MQTVLGNIQFFFTLSVDNSPVIWHRFEHDSWRPNAIRCFSYDSSSYKCIFRKRKC